MKDQGREATAIAPATAPLGMGVIEALKRYDAPTLSNAIEMFDVRPRNTGFMTSAIRCIFPEMGVMVGYAVTARIRADGPPAEGEQAVRYPYIDYWNFILEHPAPRVIVIQDMDARPGVGSFWGEVQANIHVALGCVGTVTNGGVRDLNEVRPLGFHFFAQHVIVSHAYVRLIDFGLPVEVGGITVRTGDVVHADLHGVQLVPRSIAADIPAGVDRVLARERKIIDYCKSPSFDATDLERIMRDLQEK